MQIRFKLLLLTCLLVQACSTTTSTPTPEIVETRPVRLTDQQINTVHSKVRDSLDDPKSARFGQQSATYSSKAGTAVCGMYSIRNSAGQYSDEIPYLAMIAENGAVNIMSMGKDEPETGITLRACNDLGIVL
ncbi:MAG: hypothetical protein AAF362_14135 [Pseudomonadota bacterium]